MQTPARHSVQPKVGVSCGLTVEMRVTYVLLLIQVRLHTKNIISRRQPVNAQRDPMVTKMITIKTPGLRVRRSPVLHAANKDDESEHSGSGEDDAPPTSGGKKRNPTYRRRILLTKENGAEEESLDELFDPICNRLFDLPSALELHRSMYGFAFVSLSLADMT